MLPHRVHRVDQEASPAVIDDEVRGIAFDPVPGADLYDSAIGCPEQREQVQQDAAFPVLRVAAELHVRERRQILRAVPPLLILQAEKHLPELASGRTAPQEFAQRHRDARSRHPHAVLLQVASTQPPPARV
jgi:hypothetical protein